MDFEQQAGGRADYPTWLVQQVIWKLLTAQYIVHSPDQKFYPAPVAGTPFALSQRDITIANNLFAAADAQGAFVPVAGQVAGVPDASASHGDVSGRL